MLSKKQFKTMVKESINKRALEYLLSKRKSKGQEIAYQELKMAEYLLPGYEEITINEQRSIFSIRNRMVQIYENFPSMNKKEFCQCENEITMKHIYDCEYFCENKEIEKPNFKQIFQENVREQMIISRIFEQNYEKSKRRKEETQTIVISHKDPLYYACNSTVMEQ